MTSSITNRVEEARSTLQKYLKWEETSTMVYWMKAQITAMLKKDGLWKWALGESVGTWGAFCAEALKCPVTTADHRVQNWEFYFEKHGFLPSTLGKYDAYALYYITIYGKEWNKAKVKRSMDESLDIGRRDFIMNLQGKNECEHEPEEEMRTVCTKCGKTLNKKHDKKGKS